MLVVEKKLKLRKEFLINSFQANVPMKFHTFYIFYVLNPCKRTNESKKRSTLCECFVHVQFRLYFHSNLKLLFVSLKKL